jgi:hypothetical protein
MNNTEILELLGTQDKTQHNTENGTDEQHGLKYKLNIISKNITTEPNNV